MDERDAKPDENEENGLQKKQTLLKFMGALFAAAFLLVGLSLLVKVHSMQDDIDTLNSGARENILAVEKELDSAVRGAKAAELLALAQNALLQGDTVSFHGYMAELEGYSDALSEETAAIYNDLLKDLP